MRLIPALLLLSVLFAGFPAPGSAQGDLAVQETPALKLDRWDAEAALIEQILAEQTPGMAEISGFRATLDAQRAAIPALTAAVEEELQPLRKQIEALGEPPAEVAEEAPEVAAERTRLTERIAALEGLLKRSGQAGARAAALISELTELRRQLFTREMLTRGPGLYEPGVWGRAAGSVGRVVGDIRAEIAERTARSTLDAPLFIRVILPLTLISAALFLALWLKRFTLRRLLRPAAAGVPVRRRVGVTITVALVRLLIPAIALSLALFAAWSSRLLGPLGESLLRGLAFTALVVIGANALGGTFFAPYAPHLRLSALPQSAATAAHRWLMMLAGVVGLDRVLVVQGDGLGLSIEALSLLNAALLLLGGIAVWGFVGHIAGAAPAPPAEAPAETEAGPSAAEPDEATLGPLIVAVVRVASRAAGLAAPALAVLGFFAASRFVFYPLVFSGAIIGLCILLFYLVHDSVERIVAPAGEAAETESRIRLVPVAVAFLLICAAVPVLALIWGADTTDLSTGWRAISDGFAVGDITISPPDFFSFLLVFSIGYVLTRVLQGVLSRSVLPVTGLDTGGRAAVRAGVGYVGIILAALVAISATGLDLSNLAIVAGALSVGIGFGLQNIVNNFVSGIILLIERPIKAGDWVELSSGQGYVNRVNVRSTEIQTFDRASLIVPNSELISGPVINWTHTDLNGRLIVPVGVAYGTDPKRVEAILIEIAKAHPMLLRRPAPYVLFRRFGADSLDFEIRGVLRDVNWILNVTSEINFEISRRFAEEGIEIPFAQRDLHLKNAGELGHSIGSALRGEQDPSLDNPPPHRHSGPADPARTGPDGET